VKNFIGVGAEVEESSSHQLSSPIAIDPVEESAYLERIVADYSDGEAVKLTAIDLQRDARLAELLGVLAASQQSCAKLWAPKKISENAHTKVNVS
jgi:hypothetical protein